MSQMEPCCPKPESRSSARHAVDDDDELALLTKAVGHPARVKILRLLAAKASCICGEITDEVGLAQSTVSQHLKVLKECRLVTGEIDGPRTCYCIDQAVMKRLKVLIAGL